MGAYDHKTRTRKLAVEEGELLKQRFFIHRLDETWMSTEETDAAKHTVFEEASIESGPLTPPRPSFKGPVEWEAESGVPPSFEGPVEREPEGGIDFTARAAAKKEEKKKRPSSSSQGCLAKRPKLL